VTALDPATRRKKLRYLVARRANLELEFLLRDFWSRWADAISDEDLDEVERFLAMEDLDLLEVLLRRRPLPADIPRDLFERYFSK